MNKPMKVIVTRHDALVDYLIQEGLVDPDTPVIKHATADDVMGKHVTGVLPLHLASNALTVTEVPLDIPVNLRGKELTIEEIREFADDPVVYRVEIIECAEHNLAKDAVELTCAVCDKTGLEATDENSNEFGTDWNPEDAICWSCEFSENWGYCDECYFLTNIWSHDSICWYCAEKEF